VKLTLTYQGPLPAKQRGVSPVKAALRKAFHPQIAAQAGRLVGTVNRAHMLTEIDGHTFISPVHRAFRTAVELDILLLSPAGSRLGDSDNRLKTIIDGLTCPANVDQLQGFDEPESGGPTYCLMEDDSLVQGVALDSRQWHGKERGDNNSLVIVTANIVLAHDVDALSPISNILFVL
jgi:hypothetical protein